jgi:hypothetical protein
LVFSLTKSENKRTKLVLSGELVPFRGRRMWGNGRGGLIQCKYCVHLYINGKMRPIETIPGMGGRENKEE